MKKLRVFIAGHNGMVGGAIFRLLKEDKNIQIIKKNRNQLDLTNQRAVIDFFHKTKIDQVYLAAAKVGGIYANMKFPAEFIYENLTIQANVINASFQSGIKKLLFLGSSCIYPKNTNQPIKEKQLLTGQLEKTNEAYAISKIAGIKMCESYNRQYSKLGLDYRSVMPTNLYGFGDNYDFQNSHVIPGLICKFHNAKIFKKKKVNVWGTGKVKREFLFVDDLAKACIFLMQLKKSKYYKNINLLHSHINIGSGSEITIKDLAKKIKNIVGYRGKIFFDKTKPDGIKKKLLCSKIIFGLNWKPQINLDEGLKLTYNDFLKKINSKKN
jgi:GDP-L-fucose synthase